MRPTNVSSSCYLKGRPKSKEYIWNNVKSVPMFKAQITSEYASMLVKDNQGMNKTMVKIGMILLKRAC